MDRWTERRTTNLCMTRACVYIFSTYVYTIEDIHKYVYVCMCIVCIYIYIHMSRTHILGL